MQMLEQDQILICECGSLDHTCRFSYDSEDNTIILETRLVNYKNFYQRLIRAIGYVFNLGKRKGKLANYGDFDSILISPSEARKLNKIFNKFKLQNPYQYQYKFVINNVALYTKNWYKRSDDIWEDIKKCLLADGYTPFIKEDILQIVKNQVIGLLNNDKEKIISNLIRGIDPKECWKYGYYTKEHTWVVKDADKLKEYDYYEACLRYFLSELSLISVDELGWDKDNLPKPNYKVLPLNKTK